MGCDCGWQLRARAGVASSVCLWLCGFETNKTHSFLRSFQISEALPQSAGFAQPTAFVYRGDTCLQAPALAPAWDSTWSSPAPPLYSSHDLLLLLPHFNITKISTPVIIYVFKELINDIDELLHELSLGKQK